MKKILLSILLIIPFVSISTFAINWDNTNFLDETFWSQNPTSGDIITALYGDGNIGNDRTSYTTNWTGVTCSTGNMKVVYLTPGTNSIPFNLSGNTIYVLNEGIYITTGTINMSGCASIIGSGRVQLYSTTNLSNMIYNVSKQNTIIDNIAIDGYGNGMGGVHTTKTTVGVNLYGAVNNTINKISAYNNVSYGISIYYNSNYNTINNSQFYNNIGLNSYGVRITSTSNNNVINNVLSYNNGYGIYIDGDASRNTVNNSQFFNNNYGAYFFRGKYNIFSNIHIYNNYNQGLYIRGVNTSYCIGNIFSQLTLFNNSFGSLYIEGIQSTGNVFYNTLKLPNYVGTTLNDSYLRPGTGSILGWNTGTVDTGSMVLTSENFVLPDTFFPAGNFLIQGTIGNYIFSTNYYRFGKNIPLQIKPLKYSLSGDIVYSDIPYFSGKTIGESSPVEILGHIRNFQNKVSTEKKEIKINLFSYTSGVSYTIYGDVETSYNGTITGNDAFVDIVLSNGYGQKNIFVQYSSGDAISPEYKTQINYLNEGDPTILKYYGFNSKYTTTWEVNSCDIGQMDVVYLNPGEDTIPSNLSSNTLYILNSGNYITTRVINITGCSALIGSGNIFLYSSTYLTGMISNIGKANTIIENIQIDGYANGQGGIHPGKNDNGIYFSSAKNNTITDVVVANNAINGIVLYSESNYNTIISSQFFNIFSGGVAGYGIQIQGSHNNTFNNILSYNNNYGFYLDGNPLKNTINNSQFFNNTYGVYFFHGKYNILSNIMIYNNYYGLYIRGHDSSYCYANVFNAMRIYNNYYGVAVAQDQSTGNVYYDAFLVTNNSASNYVGTTLNDAFIKPGTGLFMGRSTGRVDTGNIIMSSQYIINPKDRYDNFLINPTTSFTTRKEKRVTRSGNGPITYSFGNDIPLQNQTNKYISFYDDNYNIYLSGYDHVSKSNLSRNSLFPYGLSIFDTETYLQGNGYLKGTGSINSIPATTLVGNSPIKGAYLSMFNGGKLNISVVLQSTGTVKVEALIPSNTYIKNTSNISYTGLIQAPKIITTGGIYGVPNPCSAISVGNYTGESVYFKDDNGNSVAVNMSMPVTTCSNFDTGEMVGIYTKQENGPWTYMGNATVTIINGTKYVMFNTTHFTDFAVGGAGTGTFVINNDTATTNSLDVKLHMTMPTNTSGMKFSNDGITRSDWEPFTGTKSWYLEGVEGMKTVYAAFDIDGDNNVDIQISDNITYDSNGTSNTQGNITLTITGGATECVYGTSLDMSAQDVKIGIPYTFTGTFPSTWYCQDYRGIDEGWTLTIQTTHLYNEKGNMISGSNLLISHDPVVVEGDLACTGYNGTPTQFYSAPYEILEKSPDSNKICKVSADNVSLLVNVPANQAPGNYSGTLTLTMNGF